jgi:hypothetical protein
MKYEMNDLHHIPDIDPTDPPIRGFADEYFEDSELTSIVGACSWEATMYNFTDIIPQLIERVDKLRNALLTFVMESVSYGKKE